MNTAYSTSALSAPVSLGALAAGLFLALGLASASAATNPTASSDSAAAPSVAVALPTDIENRCSLILGRPAAFSVQQVSECNQWKVLQLMAPREFHSADQP